jgi:hypothetical protein
MSRPVVHIRFGNLAITRAKLLFIETMAVDPTLKPLELRVGIALLNTYTTHGYGETSLEHVAAALGSNKGNVSRAADGLERKGYFRILRASYRHGVRGQPNRYYPNWGKVATLQPINVAAAERKIVGSTTVEPGGDGCTDDPLGCFLAPNKVVCRTTNPDSYSLYKSCAPQRTSPSGEAHDLKLEKVSLQERTDLDQLTDQQVMGALQMIQRKLPPPTDQDAIEWYGVCEYAFDRYPAHEAHPIGGMAYRLLDELYAYLPAAEFEPEVPIAPASTEPEPEPQEESPVNGHAIAEPTPIDAPTKPQWRKPTYVEVLDTKSYPKGRKFAGWFAEQRSARGVQVAAVAQAVGLSPADWWRVETGQSEIGQAMQRQAIAALMERAA